MADKQYDPIDKHPLPIHNFTFSNILQYSQLLNTTHAIHTDNTSTIIKGQKLFTDRFVTTIGHRKFGGDKRDPSSSSDDQAHVVKATVKAEMRKGTTYSVVVVIDKDNKVQSVKCQCPGGAKPACCKHAFALLSAVEDYSRKELYAAPTERLQTWHQPRTYKVSPKKYSSTLGQPSPKTPTKDGQLSTHDKTPMKTTHHVKHTLNFNALGNLHQTMPLFSVLSMPHQKSSLLVDDICYDKTMPLPLSPGGLNLSSSHFMPDELDMSVLLEFHSRVKRPLLALQNLERETMSQNSPVWHQERNLRVTASRVYEIVYSVNFSKNGPNNF